MDAILTAEEVVHYHEHGFVIPSRFRFELDVVDRIRADHMRLVQRGAEEHPEWKDYCPALLPHDLSFVNYARDPRMLSMVSQLIGDDVCLWTMSFFAKPPHTGREVPWHQDGDYWPICPLATCTAWVACDSSHSGNGCLRVIPGSHRQRALFPHTVHADEQNKLALKRECPLVENGLDPSSAVDLVLQPGQVSLHDVYLVHGSSANTSEHPRRGMTMRFMPTTSTFERRGGNVQGHALRHNPLFLMSGRDRSDENEESEQMNDYSLDAAATGRPCFRAAKAERIAGVADETSGSSSKL